MDYRTLYIADLASLILYSVSLCAVAIGNPKQRGLRWFVTYLFLSVAKTVLQSIRGFPPLGLTSVLGTFVANEMNAFGYFAMFLGYHWFLVRKPLQSWFVPGIVFASMATYAAAFCLHTPGAFAIGMIPIFVSCAASVHLMLNRAGDSFVAVARSATVILLLQILIAGYRTILISQFPPSPISLLSLPEPRWIISMSLLMALDSLFVGSFFWFYVAEYQSVLRYQACTDNLTGALNRRALDAEARIEIARSRRGSLPLSLLVLDVDHFKLVNDTRGHDAGDLALRELVLRLIPELRAQDRIARSGGEEFLVLLPATPLAAAREVAERLRLTIERLAIPYDGLPICITISVGVAELYPEADDTWEALRRRGDDAMYTAKRLGRNRVCYVGEPNLVGDGLAAEADDEVRSRSLSRPPAA